MVAQLGRSRPAVLLAAVEHQLGEYHAGLRRTFDLPLALDGTEFQCSVWRALCEIPYGETRSYGQVAQRIARPRAVRAVGLANGANRIAIIVPCHRVVNTGGALGGYSSGLERKRYLLELERRSG
ncbi:MAG: methylated-DNA--[protein]-cysteine S-methyltransferase [Steroidobacteraceae bacterium]